MEAHFSLLLKHKKYLDGIQVVLLLVVQVFGCMVSVFGKFKYMYDRLHFTEHIFQIMDTLGVIILTYSNIRIQYSLTQNIYLLDQLDLEQKIIKFQTKKVDLLINLSYLVTAVILSLNAYFLIPSLDIQMIVYVIPQSLGLILFNIEMGVVLRNTYCIVGIVKHFNSSINPKNLQNSKLIDLKHTKSIWINYFKLIKWNSLLKEYNVICQMLDEFNEKFRNILGLIITCQVTLIIWSLTISLKFGLEAKNDAVENQKWLLVVPFVLIGISVFVSMSQKCENEYSSGIFIYNVYTVRQIFLLPLSWFVSYAFP